MKLVIVGWRPWSVTQRYRSLIINAKKLGHQILGIAAEHYKDGPMTASLFQDLGVRYVAGAGNGLHIMGRGAVWKELDKFNPHAIFGECFWCTTEEKAARDWGIRHGGRFFALDHSKMGTVALKASYCGNRPLSGMRMLAANEVNATSITRQFKVPAFPVGFPNFDIDYEIGIDKVKVGLGITDQPIVALFLRFTGNRGVALKEDQGKLFPLLALAEKRGWKVFIHLHAEEQGGRYRLMTEGRPRHKFLMALQDRGASLVSNIPGDFNGLIFKPCGPMALARVADVVGGTYTGSGSMLQAYVVAKKYFWMGDEAGSLSKYPNFVKVDSDYGSIIEAIEENTGSFEQHPAYVKRWFYKLDGKCWMRMLALVETMRRKR